MYTKYIQILFNIYKKECAAERRRVQDIAQSE